MKLMIKMLSVCVLVSVSIWSMERLDIQPYSSKAITNVPDYLYANCNQKTVFNFKAGDLSALKQNVGSLSENDIFDLYMMETYPKVNANIKDIMKRSIEKELPFPEVKEVTKEYTRFKERFDWIHAMSFLDALISAGDIEACLKDSRKIESCLKLINHKVTRFTNKTAGDFRNQGICWAAIESFTQAEKICFENADYVAQMGLQIDEQGNTALVHLKDIFSKIREREFNVRLKFGNEYTWRIGSKEFQQYIKDINQKCFPQWDIDAFDDSEFDTWVTDADTGVINWQKWYNSRVYTFPEPEQFTQELLRIKACMLDTSLHPIERAALAWYYLINIHLFGEANKRTAKVIGSYFLLKAGYLPPLITDKDGDQYVQLLGECFRKKDPSDFVSFIYEMVEKTQQMAKDGLLDVNISTTKFDKEAYESFVNDLKKEQSS